MFYLFCRFSTKLQPLTAFVKAVAGAGLAFAVKRLVADQVSGDRGPRVTSNHSRGGLLNGFVGYHILDKEIMTLYF